MTLTVQGGKVDRFSPVTLFRPQRALTAPTFFDGSRCRLKEIAMPRLTVYGRARDTELD